MDANKIEPLWTAPALADRAGPARQLHGRRRARLGVSKAAMSQRIAELERAAGVPLVRRTTRSVRLTEAGQRLVDDTRAPSSSIAHSFAGVRDLAGAPRGLLRVTAPVALGAPADRAAPGRTSCARNPRCASSSTCPTGSARWRWKASTWRSATPPRRPTRTWPGCCAPRARCWWPAAPTCAATARRAQPAGPGGARLPALPARADAPDLDASSARPARRAASASRCRSTGRFAANNSEALRDAALAGLGIALLPDFSAQAALQAGKLVRGAAAVAADRRFGEQLYAIRPYASHVPRAVTVFVAWLRERR